jgi:hypothetical protein
MFEGKSLIEILNMGGWVLLGTSILSLTAICYKVFEFYIKGKVKREEFIGKLFEIIINGNLDKAISYYEKT